jgi:sec-independent protein translocase protein TatA
MNPVRTSLLFAFFNLSPMEVIIVLLLGVLLFGRRLPEMDRFIGKGLVEFKKGLHGIEDDIDANVQRSSPATAAERKTNV